MRTITQTQDIITNFIAEAERYTTWQGKTAYRTFGDLSYYYLLCMKLGITPKIISSGLSYTAKSKLLDLDYCEHDIILVLTQ